MTSYELAEIFNKERLAVNKLCDEKKWEEAAKELKNNWEAVVKPFLDTCAFTCSDYKQREEFNKKCVSDACKGYCEATDSKDKQYYAKLYNQASNELYSLWFAWKPFINQMIKEIEDGKKYIDEEYSLQKEQEANKKKS